MSVQILIAEDDRAARVLESSILEELGHRVVTAIDGDQAWEVIRSEDTPRMLLLDRMMPGVDGTELCRRARRIEGDRPFYIIFVTAMGHKQHVVEGLEAGADDYITKPFEVRELAARVGAGVRVLTLQQDLRGRMEELEDALEHIRTLQGIIPICMYCKSIRNDQQSWQRLEDYFHEHSDACFSHGVCPECMKKYHGDDL